MTESHLSQLPPVYQVRRLGDVDDICAAGVRAAREGAGEGTLLVANRESAARGRRGTPWHSYPGNLHSALILEPDYRNRINQQLLYLAAVAAGTALAEVLSPMTGMSYGWPGRLYINNLLCGQVGIAAPGDRVDPWPWLVLSLRINVCAHPPNPEPECYNSVHASGDADLATAEQILAFFARHFLRGINRWADEGFAPVHKAWMQRAQDPGSRCILQLGGEVLEGVNQGINRAGELIVADESGKRRRISIRRYFGL